MLARQNEINLNRGRVKWVVRAAEGDGGKREKRKRNPNLCPYAGPANVFPLFRTLFAIYHLQQAAVLVSRPGEPQQTAKPKLQMKPRASQVDGAGRQEGAGRTILLAKQKGPHFLT